MTKTARMFQTAQDFTCLIGLLDKGQVLDSVKASYEAGVRVTLENIAKEGVPPVYFDHAKQMVFTEDRINFLLRQKLWGERFPEPSTVED